jgi:oxidase EvaA
MYNAPDTHTPEHHFLQSALSTQNQFNTTQQVLDWLDVRKANTEIIIDIIKFSELQNWHFDKDTGNIVHQSGKFFSIDGIDVHTNWGYVPHWQQPIINQPEVGILGIICKKIDGILHFLLQAKIEPGNINYVQLSPTVQATRSNFTQVHGGNKPRYLEYFMNDGSIRTQVLIDQLQSEQGARFLRKRNRNIIVEIFDEITPHPDFCWLTLGQIKQLLLHDNVINMDTRTVISTIDYGSHTTTKINEIIAEHPQSTAYHHNLLRSTLQKEGAMHSFKHIISWITHHKANYDLRTDRMPLKNVAHWLKDDYQIYHEQNKYFSVIAVRVTIGNREVTSWSQPLVKSAQDGIIAFIIKKINGVHHFLVQAKLEAGNLDIIELAPTVQCINDNYRQSIDAQKPAYLDFVLNIDPDKIRYNTHQSEEGGRFYREQNHNIIIEVGEEFSNEVPPSHIWMTFNQMNAFIQFNNYFNIEARSLISAIAFV